MNLRSKFTRTWVNDWIWGDVKGESCIKEERFYLDGW